MVSGQTGKTGLRVQLRAVLGTETEFAIAAILNQNTGATIARLADQPRLNLSRVPDWHVNVSLIFFRYTINMT